jgi:hypothetical protein
MNISASVLLLTSGSVDGFFHPLAEAAASSNGLDSFSQQKPGNLNQCEHTDSFLIFSCTGSQGSGGKIDAVLTSRHSIPGGLSIILSIGIKNI